MTPQQIAFTAAMEPHMKRPEGWTLYYETKDWSAWIGKYPTEEEAAKELEKTLRGRKRRGEEPVTVRVRNWSEWPDDSKEEA